MTLYSVVHRSPDGDVHIAGTSDDRGRAESMLAMVGKYDVPGFWQIEEYEPAAPDDLAIVADADGIHIRSTSGRYMTGADVQVAEEIVAAIRARREQADA